MWSERARTGPRSISALIGPRRPPDATGRPINPRPTTHRKTLYVVSNSSIVERVGKNPTYRADRCGASARYNITDEVDFDEKYH